MWKTKTTLLILTFYKCFSLLQIYPDPESEKAIMSSVVYCIHHKEGCKWSDELRKLKVGVLHVPILFLHVFDMQLFHSCSINSWCLNFTVLDYSDVKIEENSNI